MNRCLRSITAPARAWRAALLTTALLALANGAFAQQIVRPFPAAALRGTMQITNPPEMLLDGQPARLSPGARIRGLSNSLVLSASLAGQRLLVNYVRDAQGMVHEVWLLNATEAQQAMPGAATQSNYVSDYMPAPASGTQSPSRTAAPLQ